MFIWLWHILYINIFLELVTHSKMSTSNKNLKFFNYLRPFLQMEYSGRHINTMATDALAPSVTRVISSHGMQDKPAPVFHKEGYPQG